MNGAATIEGGFAKVGAGLWLAGRGQPAAFSGSAARRRRAGWRVRDRSALDLIETSAEARFSDSSRPFLTHIQCAAPVFAVSGKVLVAPASARKDAHLIRLVPMSARNALCVTEFREEWTVAATASRTARVPLADGETLSVRPGAVVAWTGGTPTGFCPRLSLLDMLLPRGPRDLLFTFYGPGIVWIEGAGGPSSAFKPSVACRGAYGV
ncbi:MAG: hypothetical protein ILO34_07505 [Kiritimatiellae bacterium]|nr:hypothetical protein [Kiritimatiellia bacterium]